MTSDARRLNHVDPPPLDGGGVDAQIEDLLLVGLDHYFAARYEQAIHVWTRVLFLDRGHARARAYIERARSALAERQRESEELLHHGVDAFDRGDASAARELITSAVERGAPQDEALAVLGRLDRLEAAAPVTRDATPRRRRRARHRPAADPSVREAPRPNGLLAPLAVMTFSVLALVLVAAFSEDIERWLELARIEQTGAPAGSADRPLVVPTASESALARARALALRGQLGRTGTPGPADLPFLREALRVLESIKPGDPLRVEADALRAQVQRLILATVGSGPPVGPGEPSDNPR